MSPSCIAHRSVQCAQADLALRGCRLRVHLKDTRFSVDFLHFICSMCDAIKHPLRCRDVGANAERAKTLEVGPMRKRSADPSAAGADINGMRISVGIAFARHRRGEMLSANRHRLLRVERWNNCRSRTHQRILARPVGMCSPGPRAAEKLVTFRNNLRRAFVAEIAQRLPPHILKLALTYRRQRKRFEGRVGVDYRLRRPAPVHRTRASRLSSALRAAGRHDIMCWAGSTTLADATFAGGREVSGEARPRRIFQSLR